MATTTVSWLKGMQFVATDSTNHSVVISSAKEGVGMKPSELVAAALGSCTAYDVVNILTKRRVKFTDVTVEVQSEQRDEQPAAFTSFHLHYTITGQDITEKEVERAIQLSEEKYCSVSATLKQAAQITFDYEIIAN